MAILSSEVVIRGRDAGVGAMFESIAAKIDRMAKSAKVSEPFTNLANGLSKAEAQLKALEKVNSSKVISDIAKQRAATTKAALEQSRQLVAATEAPTKAMQRDLAAREAAHAKAVSMYRREATVAMEARRTAVDQGLDLRNREAQQSALRRTIESTTVAMERQVAVERKATTQAAAMERAAHQRREFIERRGVGHLVTQTAGNYLAAHSIVTGLEHAASEGANLAHVQNQARAAGIPAGEVQGMTDQALSLSGRYKNVSQESLIELAKEVLSAVIHPHEVPAIMPTLAAAKSVLSGIDKNGEAGGSLAALVKGAESIGAAQSPERLNKLIDAYVRGMQVMGTTINPSEILDFDRNSRLAGAQFSDRFLMTTGLSLAQELSGATAGKGAAEAVSQMTSGLGKRTVAATQLMNLGLVDRGDLRFNKIGEVSGVKKGVLHPVKGDSLLASDPDRWTYEVLLPAMEKHGMTKQEDQIAAIRQIFSGSKTAQDIVGKFLTQRESFQAHAERYGEASGIKGADQMASDPLVAWQGFTTQLGNLAGNLAEPAVKAAGPALDSIAAGLGHLSAAVAQFNKDHPTFAPVAEGAGAAGALAVGGWAAWKATQGTLGLFGRALGLGGAEGGAAGIAGAAGGEAGAAAGSIGAAGAALPIMAGLGVMGGGIYLLSHSGGKTTASGRAQPASQKDTDQPGHLAYARGGAPIWVADPVAPNTMPEPVTTPPLDIRPPIQRETAAAYPPITLSGGAVAGPIPAAPLPIFARTPAANSGMPQVVDVTGKVQADVTSHVETAVTGKFELIVPAGFESRQTFQSQTTRVSNGPSMPNAGAAPHVARRDE